MPTITNRIRAFLRSDDRGPYQDVSSFASPPKVITSEPIAPGPSEVVPEADPRTQYIAGGAGRFFSGFAYGSGGAVTLDQYASEVTRQYGPTVLEAMRRDAKVNSSINTRKAAILSGGVQIAPAVQVDPTAGPDSDQANDPDVVLAAEVCDFCQRLLDRLPQPIEEVLSALLDSMVHGVKLGEMVGMDMAGGPDDGRLVLEDIKVRPNAAWAFVVDPGMTTLGYLVKTPIRVGQAGGPGGAGRLGGYAVLPPEKCVVHTWKPRDGDPRGTSILEAVYQPWNFKVQSWTAYGRYLAQFASAFLVGKVAKGAQPQSPRDAAGNVVAGPKVTAEKVLADQLANAGNGSFIVLPPDADVAPISPQGDGTPFLNVFDFCDRQIVSAILEQTRATMEAVHGSKADSQTGQDMLGMAIRLDRIALAHTIRNQILKPFVRWNFGDDAADRLTATVSLGGTEHQDKAQMLAAYAAAGYAIDPSQLPWVDHDLGLKVREVKEPEPVAEQPPAVDPATGLPMAGPNGQQVGQAGPGNQVPPVAGSVAARAADREAKAKIAAKGQVSAAA